MQINLREVIVDSDILGQRCVVRDGYVFTAISEPGNVYDALIIRNPYNIFCRSPRFLASPHSLEDHIRLVNTMGIEKAVIIGTNMDFLPSCPSLSSLRIIPANCSADQFDFSPLYQMPCIRQLSCKTVYGEKDQHTGCVDYSQISGLQKLSVSNTGHLNFEKIEGLKSLGISGYKGADLTGLFSSRDLDTLSMIQCKIKSLDGLQRSKKMQCLYLYHNRALQDISALSNVQSTLKALRIENCPKIADFSVLGELKNLEMLELSGNNSLPNLDFIRSMKGLKTFIFSVNVLDGNLSPCLNLSYAYSEKNRKHYNLKDAELPKGMYVRGNENIEEWRRWD